MPHHAKGFTYLTALFLVALLGLASALTGQVWRTASQREREAQLLYVGGQYRRAIERYYLAGPAQYPKTLHDLLKDGRQPRTERYLRRPYPDPVTDSDRWGLVRTPGGEIMGVHSLSERKPIRTTGFGAGNDFQDAKSYADWKFVYVPGQRQASVPASGTSNLK